MTQATETKILYVDDEKINLDNFRLSFADEFTIFTAADGADALDILKKHGEMAVVVTDQRMPLMTGVELLRQVAGVSPHTVRMILTAYTDPEDIIAAINLGQINRYIIKPWNTAELRLCLKNGAELYRLSSKNEELLTSLKKKNQELFESKNLLEIKVRERTAQLKDANTDLKALNRELLQKIVELRDTREQMGMVSKLIPICSYCKKIRDDHDYWHELEIYMAKEGMMDFSHGVCPDCYRVKVQPALDAIKGPDEQEPE